MFLRMNGLPHMHRTFNGRDRGLFRRTSRLPSHVHSDTSRSFPKPASGRIAVKVINHLGDEMMKVFRVNA